jgi:hypothetical protein
VEVEPWACTGVAGAVSGYAYAGTAVVDARDPARPAVVARTGPLKRLSPDRRYGFQVGAVSGTGRGITFNETLRVYDLSDPSAPRAVGAYHRDVPGSLLTDVAVVGDRGYAGWGQTTQGRPSGGGVRVFDLADPTRLALVGNDAGFATEGYVSAVASDGRWLFTLHPTGAAALRPSLLRVLDLSDPLRPTEAGSFGYCGYRPVDVAAAAGYAYVTAGADGLGVFAPGAAGPPPTPGAHRLLLPAVAQDCGPR